MMLPLVTVTFWLKPDRMVSHGLCQESMDQGLEKYPKVRVEKGLQGARHISVQQSPDRLVQSQANITDLNDAPVNTQILNMQKPRLSNAEDVNILQRLSRKSKLQISKGDETPLAPVLHWTHMCTIQQSIIEANSQVKTKHQ